MFRHHRALFGVERRARAALVAASGAVSCLNGSADPIVRVDSSVASDAEARTDAAPSEAAASSLYCASLSPQPLFCEDFDEGSYAQGFTVHAMSGAISLGTAEFVSPPAAAVVMSDALADGGPREDTALYASFGVSTGTFDATLDVDLRVDRADSSGGGAALAQIGLVDAAGSEYFVQFTVTANAGGALPGALAEVYVPATGPETYTGHPFPQGLPLSTWTHVTLSISAPSAGGAGMATLAYDGTPVATTAIDVKVSGFAPVLGVGLPFVSTPSTGWTAALDNVVLRATNP